MSYYARPIKVGGSFITALALSGLQCCFYLFSLIKVILRILTEDNAAWKEELGSFSEYALTLAPS